MMLDHNKYIAWNKIVLPIFKWVFWSILVILFYFFPLICESDFGILVNVVKQGWKHRCKIVNLFTIRNNVTYLESTQDRWKKWYHMKSQASLGHSLWGVGEGDSTVKVLVVAWRLISTDCLFIQIDKNVLKLGLIKEC